MEGTGDPNGYVAEAFFERHERVSRLVRFAGAGLVGVTGVAVGTHASTHLLSPAEPGIGIMLSTFVITVIAVPLVAGSVWLLRSDFSDREVFRVVEWGFAGMVPLGLLMVILFYYQQSHGIWLTDVGFMVRSVAGVGLLGGVFTGIYDVRQRTEKDAHRRTARRLDAVIEAAPVAIVKVDETNRVETWNDGAERLFGWQEREVLGESCPIRLAAQPDDGEADEWSVFDIGGAEEIQCERRDGSQVTVERRIAPLYDDGGERRGKVGIFVDTTEHNRRRQQLTVLHRVLRHNLRNIVTVIEGRAEHLQTLAENPEVHHSSRSIVDAARKLESLSEKASKIQSALQHETDHVTWVDVVDILEQQCEELQREHPEADITLETPDSAWVHTDYTVAIAFREAIENAIEHNDRESPQITITVDEPVGPSALVDVSIADDGPGIPHTDRRAIEMGEETPLEHASGLGIWLIKLIVTTAGGTVSISDNEPRGSVVHLSLPAEGTVETAEETERLRLAE